MTDKTSDYDAHTAALAATLSKYTPVARLIQDERIYGLPTPVSGDHLHRYGKEAGAGA